MSTAVFEGLLLIMVTQVIGQPSPPTAVNAKTQEQIEHWGPGTSIPTVHLYSTHHSAHFSLVKMDHVAPPNQEAQSSWGLSNDLHSK